MVAGERLVAQDGYEVALFPMPYLRMSQDEGGDYSHQGTYNIDLLGWSANGRIYQAPLYAPCTMKIVAVWMTYNAGNRVVWESVNKVHLADGSLDYLCISNAHDNNPPYTVIGTTVNQGQRFYDTGTYGIASGDHVHSCLGKGHYQGFTQRPPYNHEDLTNRIHYWDGVYINDTVISQGYGHDWRIWNEPSPAPFKKKFPWVLYAEKLRNNR